MALQALKCCANFILNSIITVGDDRTNQPINAQLACLLSAILVPAARHSYRLVRREFLSLVSHLDWSQLQFVERSFVRSQLFHSSFCLKMTRFKVFRVKETVNPNFGVKRLIKGESMLGHEIV